MISCLCPTYGRCPDNQWLLEEAIESFLRQRDLDPLGNEAELLILNDCPEQELVIDPWDLAFGCDLRDCWLIGKCDPPVRIINHPRRFESLGEKFNFLAEQARGEILMPWEDDDISLPLRIAQAKAAIEGQRMGWMWNATAGVWSFGGHWKPPQVWFMVNGQPPVWKHNVGVRHHASVFTRQAFNAVGGYPKISGSQDAGMDARLIHTLGFDLDRFPEGIPPEQWQYIYRWGVSPNHLSGNTDHEAAWRAEAMKPKQPGRFRLRPHWRQDYVALCREALAADRL